MGLVYSVWVAEGGQEKEKNHSFSIVTKNETISSCSYILCSYLCCCGCSLNNDGKFKCAPFINTSSGGGRENGSKSVGTIDQDGMFYKRFRWILEETKNTRGTQVEWSSLLSAPWITGQSEIYSCTENTPKAHHP